MVDVTIKKTLICAGTRPEIIKLLPVIDALRQHPEKFNVRVVSTGQHREIANQLFSSFKLKPDIDLDVMQQEPDLNDLTARIILGMNKVFDSEKPDLVVVQGDTATVLATALAAFYRKIQVAHVEAGVRSFDRLNPFPEEINRRLTSQLADFHFAPSEMARSSLMREGIPADRIFVTGNTVVDALRVARDSAEIVSPEVLAFSKEFPDFILCTMHRRESQGKQMREICEAIRASSLTHSSTRFILLVHPNPRVREVVTEVLQTAPGVSLLGPQDYYSFLHLMARCRFILTDSGGVQEEAPYYQKRVLVLREVTDRPETLTSGVAQLVGTSRPEIEDAVTKLCASQEPFPTAEGSQLYGDGHAAQRIADILIGAL